MNNMKYTNSKIDFDAFNWPISVRMKNALNHSGLRTYDDVRAGLAKNPRCLYLIRNIGPKCLDVLIPHLEEKGIDVPEPKRSRR